jgi:hypothetical protein
MDNLVVPFVDVMLGSFVFVVGLLFVLGLVDEFKQRRGFEPAQRAAGVGAGREPRLVTLVSAKAQAENIEHAKAA